MAVKNRTESVLRRLKNRSKETGISFQVTLQLFAQEEFLRKLSKSEYSKYFVLKGGMFVYTLTHFETRPTRDTDLMIREYPLNQEQIKTVMNEICRIETGNDFITFEILRTGDISLDKPYPGVKTWLMGHVNNVRIPFSVDIGVDDIIIPSPVRRELSTLLPDFESPELYTYSLESTIAEKLDAILSRMSGTSRMKDFYDIYFLSELFDFDGTILRDSVSATLKHRGRIMTEEMVDEIHSFPDNTYLQIRWNAFEPAVKSGLLFSKTVERMMAFLKPVCISIIRNENFCLHWNCTDGKWI